MKHKEIPFSIPFIDQEEIDEVVKVLQGKWITTGSEVTLFEDLVKKTLGIKCAVALSSGTAALDISLKVNGVGPGDQVLTTAYTFVSTALSIIHKGAEPVFADVEANTFNIDPLRIQEKINRDYDITPAGLRCKRNQKILKGIIAVHFGGQPAEMETINKIAAKNDLFVIEDAAHAIGAAHRGNTIGKSDNFVCFSFYSNKNMTTGEGGMIVTNRGEIEKKIRMYSLHGISKSNRERYHTGLPFYDVEFPGYKANLTDIQAALGVVQIRKLETINKKRKQIAQWYDLHLQEAEEIRTPFVHQHNSSAYHLYPILLAPRLKEQRDQVILGLREQGIYPSVHFIPVHFHSFFKNYCYTPVDLPVTENLFQREISLPIHPGMTEDDVSYTTSVLKEILSKF